MFITGQGKNIANFAITEILEKKEVLKKLKWDHTHQKCPGMEHPKYHCRSDACCQDRNWVLDRSNYVHQGDNQREGVGPRLHRDAKKQPPQV
jgi:hypothetical protein